MNDIADKGTTPEAGTGDTTGPGTPTVNAVRYGFDLSYGVLLLVLPPLVYYMWICMTFYGGAMVLPRSLPELRQLLSHVSPPTWKAVGIYGAWFALQAVLQVYAPGPLKEGAALPDGSRLSYRMNGWFSWWFTLALCLLLPLSGLVPATLLWDHFGPLLTVANLFTFALSGYLYWIGKHRDRDRERRVTGRPLYDYFMGTALNPRDGGFDWKLFCEARPGLMLWVLLNFSLAAKQYQTLGHLTTPMVLVCAFHFMYITDYFYHEEAILSTWDIRHEQFGWMLCWGDLVWLPFTYTLQAQYLLSHPHHELSGLATAGIVALHAAGFYLFRSANLQKHRFRGDPQRPIWGQPPSYLRTERGTLLLTSGWWGVGRHMNYTGDLMMALSWCLTCGFQHLLPYFYIIYFTILLVHRERRDNAFCQKRYGSDWDAYCDKVRWRMLPGVY